MRITPGHSPDHPLSTIIIGCGFSGLGMGIELKKQQIDSFLILEKGSELGGTWRDNTYPGATCDVPSALYSFSFEPKPDWNHRYARQKEILDYLRHCANKYKVRKHIQLNSEVCRAQFHETGDLWQVDLKGGPVLWCNTLISACGQLNAPKWPDIPNLNTFQGETFHSAQWNHETDLTGKNVTVVGTGASAIQIIPAIVNQVGSLTVFQRSAPYVLPKADHAYSRREKQSNRQHAVLMRFKRLGYFLKNELLAPGFTRFGSLLELLITRPFQEDLKYEIKDQSLRTALTPNTPAGCKRVLLSNNYFSAMAQANTRLVTEPIESANAEGLQTQDGKLYPADVIVMATGFRATDFPNPISIRGLNDQELTDYWKDGASAYLGLAVPNFPNFFMLYGPNTNLGHNSVLTMMEAQIKTIGRLFIKQNRAQATRIEVNSDVYNRFKNRIRKALQHTVWAGCTSWYTDTAGRNTTNWPYGVLRYQLATRLSRLRSFNFTASTHARIPARVRATVYKNHNLIDRLLGSGLAYACALLHKILSKHPISPAAYRRATTLLSLFSPMCLDVFRQRIKLLGTPSTVFSTRQKTKPGALLYIHGGNFCAGSSYSQRALASQLARLTQIPVFSVDYRLAPEHPYPCALDDVQQAYEGLLEQGFEPNQIALIGENAGAGLALALCVRLNQTHRPRPSSMVLISPLTSQPSPNHASAWTQRCLRQLDAPQNPAPEDQLDNHIDQLPPLFIHTGDQEHEFDDSLMLAYQAQSFGVPCEVHVLEGHNGVLALRLAHLKASKKALHEMTRFVTHHLENEAQRTQFEQPDSQPEDTPLRIEAGKS